MKKLIIISILLTVVFTPVSYSYTVPISQIEIETEHSFIEVEPGYFSTLNILTFESYYFLPHIDYNFFVFNQHVLIHSPPVPIP